MGRPLGSGTTIHQVQGIHRALLAAGASPGDKWTRDDWRSFLILSAEVAVAQERNITQTGEALGLWKRLRSPNNRDDVVELGAGLQFGLDQVGPLGVPA